MGAEANQAEHHIQLETTPDTVDALLEVPSNLFLSSHLSINSARFQ